MAFINLSREDRVKWCAELLGLSPNHPDSWPQEAIEREIAKCNHLVETELRDWAHYTMSKNR